MAQAENKATEKTKTTAKKFALEKLGQHCMELFGVTSSAFVGATFQLAPGEYTVAEVKEVISKWKKKEAK